MEVLLTRNQHVMGRSPVGVAPVTKQVCSACVAFTCLVPMRACLELDLSTACKASSLGGVPSGSDGDLWLGEQLLNYPLI